MDLGKIGEKDLYELFGLSSDCTTAEVRKAYRKKALECHPDKNPDNPKAGEIFNELTEALAILLDEKARATYDRILNARKAAKLRLKQLDERRKRFKADLELREAQYISNRERYVTDEEKLKEEVARLRKEGARLLEEELKLVQQEVCCSLNRNIPESGAAFRIKVEWVAEENEGPVYTRESLENIFRKYGDIAAVVCLQKRGKGNGIVEFKERTAAELAMKLEVGLLKCPLKLKWMDKDKDKDKNKNKSKSRCNLNIPSHSLITERDFEDLYFRRIRQAEERKRLIAELEK